MTALDTFLSLAGAAVTARATGPAAPAATRIPALLATPPQPAPPQPAPPQSPTRLPACAHLPAALAEMRADLAAAFTALEPQLCWKSRVFPDAKPGFNTGHANARILGPEGLEQRGGLIAGFSLVGPNITYPDHDHPPEEIYLALSGGAWWNTDTPWHEPGPGRIVHNPPGIRHAMRGTNVPLLAIWFLLPSE